MDALIKKLEDAVEGSRELDASIYESTGLGKYHSDEWRVDRHLPHYTTSIDAALTLVPEGWDWLTGGGESWTWPKCGMVKGHRVTAATPALALCIAALRARQATEKE